MKTRATVFRTAIPIQNQLRRTMTRYAGDPHDPPPPVTEPDNDDSDEEEEGEDEDMTPQQRA
jgi:hypothetical protein